MVSSMFLVGASLAATSAIGIAGQLRNKDRKKILAALKAAGIKRKAGKKELPPIIRIRRVHYGHRVQVKLPPGKSTTNIVKAAPAIREAIRKDIEVGYDHRYGSFIDIFEADLPDHIPYDPKLAQGYRVPIGIDRRGRIHHYDFSGSFPHLLIGGISGGGKSVLLRSIITSLSLQEKKPALYLADLKGGVELSTFATLKNCEGFATTIEGVQAMLADIEAEMKKRLGAMRSNGNRKWRGQRIIFIMDEMVDLAGVQGEAKEMKAIRAAVKASLASISAKGRAASISLVLCTQRPDARVIDGIIKTNIASSIGFRTRDEVQSRIIIDGTQLASLPDIPGRAIFQQAENILVQTFFLSHQEAEELLKGIERRKQPNEYRDAPKMESDFRELEDFGLFNDWPASPTS